ncbi:MAG: hypothetical protein QMC89_05205 [Candidatus Hodarchaeaceae archaeon]|nr:hypothetical protein [Candidatus Hodarchaeaceae archaeon]
MEEKIYLDKNALKALAFGGGILGVYRFVEGITVAPEVPGVPPPIIPPQVVHEPAYLIVGLALISIGLPLSYLGLRIWKRMRTRS